MRPRIMIGEFKLETNSFVGKSTDLAAFRARYVKDAAEVLPFFRGVEGEMGGFIDVCEAADAEIIPAIAANATPGGRATREAFDYVVERLVASARAARADGILLSLHGAMVVEDEPDGEGALLGALREAVGPNVPIVCVLDLHANMTEAMVRRATALVGYETNPHADSYARAREAADLLLRIVRGEVRPVMALRHIPVLCPPLNTRSQPMIRYMERVREWKKMRGVLSASFFHGFFRADIALARMSALAVTDNDPALAQRIVDDMYTRVMGERESFVKVMPSPEEAILRAMAAPKGPIVLADVSDNPGGGAPGDATHVLRDLLRLKAKDVALAMICDPETAQAAAKAGVGAIIPVRLGGKSEAVSGTPVETTATVLTLSNGEFRNKGPVRTGLLETTGLTAVLQVGGVDVLVTSLRAQPMDPEIFRRNGIEPRDKKILVVKSAQHFRAAYESIGKEIIEMDAPGMASQHPKHFDFKNIARPVYPLDDIVG